MNKNYQREYQRQWISNRRQFYLDKYGPCFFCGSSDRLEIHHVNPEIKNSHRIWSWSEARIEDELKQCVILCRACHSKFHALLRRKPLIHGTLHAYQQYKCRCELCRAANARKKPAIKRKVPSLKKSTDGVPMTMAQIERFASFFPSGDPNHDINRVGINKTGAPIG